MSEQVEYHIDLDKKLLTIKFLGKMNGEEIDDFLLKTEQHMAFFSDQDTAFYVIFDARESSSVMRPDLVIKLFKGFSKINEKHGKYTIRTATVIKHALVKLQANRISRMFGKDDKGKNFTDLESAHEWLFEDKAT